MMRSKAVFAWRVIAGVRHFCREHQRSLRLALVTAFAVSSGLGLALTASASPASAETGAWFWEASKGGGADSCTHYSASQWNTYWETVASDVGVGVYIGGGEASAVGCTFQNAAFVTGLTQSIQLVPIYDGYQLPCTGQAYKMSSNTTTAASQGKAAADDAINKLNAIGVGLVTIVYLDVEAAGSGLTAACQAAGLAYVHAWVTELHENSEMAGLYSSACSPNMSVYAAAPPPDDVWVADYNGKASASTSSVTTSCLPASMWTTHQRIHQYRGAGVTAGLSVDLDCIDGLVDNANGAGTNVVC
jgi:hypothetical protein